MNILFLTQSGSIRLFDGLREELDKRVSLGQSGFILSDSHNYLKWLERRPEFETAGHLLLKEWEVTSKRSGQADLARLKDWEEVLGGPGLFGAVIADRRLLMGPNCAHSQDYRRRFSDNELLRILECGVAAVERLFDELRPDLVVGFICTTFLEYIAALFAKSRGIKYLNLRPMRIDNTVLFGSTVFDPAPELAAAYHRIRKEGSSRHGEAEHYIQKIRSADAKYEGVVSPSTRPARRVRARLKGVNAGISLLQEHIRYKRSIAADDNHCPGILKPFFFTACWNPLRAYVVDRALRDSYVTAERLRDLKYAFFPLHTEPEVSLLVYARPFVNQIEAVRTMAFSLPVDMTLVVKEHPWMVGKRNLSAYRKLLNIPRVQLASPDLDSRTLLQEADLMVGINSSVALEAAILRKPVLLLGRGPFTLLPETMVRRSSDLLRLSEEIRDLLVSHLHDEGSLKDYFAAVLECSTGVNLYSTLLGRQNVHSNDELRPFEEEVRSLADYLVARIGRAGDRIQLMHTLAAPW